MGSKIEYVDSSQMYATSYVRNSKAIGVLWGIFTICYAIISVVSFVTSEWIGYKDGEFPGKFGLWSVCYAEENGEICDNHLDNFLYNLNAAFQAATIFVGLGVVSALLTVCAMLLFFFCRSTTVFHMCGWLQLFSALCLMTGCIAYPAGWDDPNVQKVCGPSFQFNLGNCGIRWAYLLAAIGCLDSIILSILAFILASRHIILQPDPHYASPSLYKGEMNGAFLGDSVSVAGSRKSLSMHPVLLMHPNQDDTYSQFSQRTAPRSLHSGHYSHPHMHHNFQL